MKQFEITDELAARFNNRYKVNEATSCWEWLGYIGKGNHGYGTFNIKGRTHKAHRVSYILNIGKIKDNLKVCHRCDVRHCVNPEHLFLGTQLANVRDMIKKNRQIILSGERHGMAKVNWEIVDKIRKEVLISSKADLERKYNLPQTTVSHICLGKTWKPENHPNFNKAN